MENLVELEDLQLHYKITNAPQTIWHKTYVYTNTKLQINYSSC